MSLSMYYVVVLLLATMLGGALEYDEYIRDRIHIDTEGSYDCDTLLRTPPGILHSTLCSNSHAHFLCMCSMNKACFHRVTCSLCTCFARFGCLLNDILFL